jgi:hypothetical protein
MGDGWAVASGWVPGGHLDGPGLPPLALGMVGSGWPDGRVPVVWEQ